MKWGPRDPAWWIATAALLPALMLILDATFGLGIYKELGVAAPWVIYSSYGGIWLGGWGYALWAIWRNK